MLKTGQVWSGLIVCRDTTRALSTPTVGPVGTLYVNGIANGATVTITGSNPYKWSVTLPSLTAGDTVQMYITATIAGVATAAIAMQDVGDTSSLSDLATAIATRMATFTYTAPDNAGIGAIGTALGNVTYGLAALLAAINTRLQGSTYVAPANSDIAAIKLITDQFRFTTANQVDANALSGGAGATQASVDDIGLVVAQILLDMATIQEFVDGLLSEATSGHRGTGTVGKAIYDGGAGDNTLLMQIKQTIDDLLAMIFVR